MWRWPMLVRNAAAFVLTLLIASVATAAELHINGDQPVFADSVPFTISGTSDVPGGMPLTLAIDDHPYTTTVDTDGTWSLTVADLLKTGTYILTATAGSATTTQFLRVQLRDNVLRQSPFMAETQYALPAPVEDPNAFQEMTDRWRIVPPPYELDEHSRGRKFGTRGASTDPYNRNLLKGDYPIFNSRQDWFFVLTGISDTLAESRTLPTPSGVSAVHAGRIGFFGDDN